ncbi:hypothetical protein AB0I81_39905 [Nonomuraea sp. NPDC050404]|uniref:hypothetical protein n=1 Tax=Nonomuraea sp. NPDC050404 TaxID=3155783 RepID=UPI0033E0BAA7
MRRLLAWLRPDAGLPALADEPEELWLDPFRFDWADEPGICAKTGARYTSPYTPRSA